jgi:hypothetical protein
MLGEQVVLRLHPLYEMKKHHFNVMDKKSLVIRSNDLDAV